MCVCECVCVYVCVRVDIYVCVIKTIHLSKIAITVQ